MAEAPPTLLIVEDGDADILRAQRRRDQVAQTRRAGADQHDAALDLLAQRR